MRWREFDAVLFDIDGTLCAHSGALPGAAEAVADVRARGVKFACVTNNCASTVGAQVARLAGAGIDAPAGAIYTSGTAMAGWVRRRFRRARVFNFAGEALADDLRDEAEFVRGIDGECDVVAVGTHMRENAVAFEIDAAMDALFHLKRGAELLVGSPDRIYMYDGKPEFGSGAFGALFAFAADLPSSRVHYAGKPDPEFFLHLCERLDVRPQRCLLIGDNLEADIAGGMAVGMTTALVLTGVTSRAEAANSHIKPHVVFDDLAALRAAMG